MICDFSDLNAGWNEFPYLLIDGEGELIDLPIQEIDLSSGVGRGPGYGPTAERFELVPPLTLVSGSGLVIEDVP